MKKLLLIISLVTFPLVGHADRGWHHDRDHRQDHFWNRVAKRLDRQYFRIENGIQNGDLTRREARKLKRDHQQIDERIARLRQKSWLSEREKRRILAHLDKASERIYHLKHNGRSIRHLPGERNLSRRHNKKIAWSDEHDRARFYLRF